MDSSEIGRFGTLRLMKRVDPAMPVAAFPIDDDTVTFGRDPTCSVRLYYSTVSPIHAKLIFQDKKAFVVVLGQSGIHVDGCPVLPSQNPSLPTTIPVLNNTTLEIRGKRFVFTYPPKEMRAALYSHTKNMVGSTSTDATMTPRTQRKKLRMSMIRSAKVFTPRGKIADPVENLRILQTPLKRRGSSPLKQQYQTLRRTHNGRGDSDSSSDSDEHDENNSRDGNGEEEEIVLVDGDHPHVLEEDKDLVILESVEVEVPEPPPPHSPRQHHRQRQQQQPQLTAPPTTPLRLGAFGRPVNVQPSNPNVYQTPHRTPARPSLHRAVLIRSAQRVVLRQEIEQEEEEMEEKEVEEVIVDDLEDVHEDEDEEEDRDRDEEAEETGQPSGWQRSLGLVKGFGWPFRSSSAAPEGDEKYDTTDHLEGEETEMDVDPQTLSADSLQTSDSTTDASYNDSPPAHQSLGAFMTPQIPRVGPTTGVGRGAGRQSFGGVLAPQLSSPTVLSGPKRVRVEPKWKVTDIVVPMLSAKEGVEMGKDLAMGVPHVMPLKEEQEARTGMGGPSPDHFQRRKLSEEEKQAIRERRRSALSTPDPYIGRHVPGMGPQHSNIHTQAPLPALFTPGTVAPSNNATKINVVGKGRSRSLSPVKMAMRLGSPTKVDTSIEEKEERHSESDEDEDTRSLLDRMKQTVEGLKRRRSESALVQGGVSGGSSDGMGVSMGDGQENDTRLDDVEEDEKSDAGDGESDKENGGAQSNGGPMDVEATVEALSTPDINAANGTEAELLPSNQEKDEDAPTDLPLPALTRPSSATTPQTPHLGPLKHLFSLPKEDAGITTPAAQSVRHLFKGAPVFREGVQTPNMDGIRTMYLREEGKGVGTPALEGVKEMMGTPVAYQQVPAGEKGGGQDDDCDKHTYSAAPPTTTTRRRTPRPNGNSGALTTEGTVVLKPEESSFGGFPGQTVPTATAEVLPDTAPNKAKSLRGRKQTPVNDELNPSGASASSESKAVGSRKAKVEGHSEAMPTMPKRPPSRAKARPIPEVVAETKTTRNEPVIGRPRSRLGTTKVSQSSSSSVPATVPPARGTRGGVRRGGGGTDNARGRSGSGSGPRSGRSTPSETTAQSPVDENEDDPLDTIAHAPKEDGPALKRRTRTTTTKAKFDEAEGGASGPAGRTRRAPTPSMVKPPTTVPAAPPPPTRSKAGASTTRKKVAGLTATVQATPEVSSEAVDKENTPSRDDEGTSGQDTSGNTAITKTTITTTRARRGNTAGAKTKEGEKEGGSAKTAGVKTRSTRATTRSRT